jgi:hypothetical protein
MLAEQMLAKQMLAKQMLAKQMLDERVAACRGDGKDKGRADA